jgi:hypothetical protein
MTVMRMRWSSLGSLVFLFMFMNVAYAGVYCNQGETLSTDCGDIDMYGCCDGSAVIFCEPATGNLCKWDCELNVLQSGGNCYGKCGGYKQSAGGAFLCGCDPNCVALGDCCDDICDDCADIIPECVDASGSTVCGWEFTKGWYDCMTTPVSGPPEHPMNCDGTSGFTCTPACVGKHCGLDGCGGVCGVCSLGLECTVSGTCISICTPNCAGKDCGSDGCEGTCGTCYSGKVCKSDVCTEVCTPNCFQNGSVCGDDGCGGECGYCGGFMTCADGNCVDVPAEDVPGSEKDTIDSFISTQTDPGGSDASAGGGSFIVPYEEPGVKVEEGSSCSASTGESAIIVWSLFCLGLLYIVRRKS